MSEEKRYFNCFSCSKSLNENSNIGTWEIPGIRPIKVAACDECYEKMLKETNDDDE